MTYVKVLAIALFAALLVHCRAVEAFGGSGEGCGGNCKACHSLSANEVKDALDKVKVPFTKIVSLKESNARGLWEVVIENKGQTVIFYMDFGKKHLIVGPMIEVNSGANKTAETMRKAEESKRVDVKKIPLDQALLLGSPKASKKVIVFTDPDCPFCGKLHSELKKVVEQNKDIAFYIKLYPLPMHKDARWKSQTIVCSRSLEYLDDNFSGKVIPQKECASKEVDNTVKLAESLGIGGTPTLIFPKGRVRSGFIPADDIVRLANGSSPSLP